MNATLYRSLIIAPALLLIAALTYQIVIAEEGKNRLPHGLRGTYLVVGEGAPDMKVLVNPTVVNIESRLFLYGKVSEHTEKIISASSEFAGKDAYIPLNDVTSIQELNLD